MVDDNKLEVSVKPSDEKAGNIQTVLSSFSESLQEHMFRKAGNGDWYYTDENGNLVIVLSKDKAEAVIKTEEDGSLKMNYTLSDSHFPSDDRYNLSDAIIMLARDTSAEGFILDAGKDCMDIKYPLESAVRKNKDAELKEENGKFICSLKIETIGNDAPKEEERVLEISRKSKIKDKATDETNTDTENSTDEETPEDDDTLDTVEARLLDMRSKWLQYIQACHDDLDSDFRKPDDKSFDDFVLTDPERNDMLALETTEGRLLEYTVTQQGDNLIEKISYDPNQNEDSRMHIEDAMAMVRGAALRGWPDFEIKDADEKEKDLLYLAMLQVNKELPLDKQMTIKGGYTPKPGSPAADLAKQIMESDTPLDNKYITDILDQDNKAPVEEALTEEIPDDIREAEVEVLSDEEAREIEERFKSLGGGKSHEERMLTDNDAEEQILLPDNTDDLKLLEDGVEEQVLLDDNNKGQKLLESDDDKLKQEFEKRRKKNIDEHKVDTPDVIELPENTDKKPKNNGPTI